MKLIRWERTKSLDGWYGKSGAAIVAIVVEQYDGVIAWQISSVHMKYIGKGYGEASRVDTAKKAVERNWQRWLRHFGLEPSPQHQAGAPE